MRSRLLWIALSVCVAQACTVAGDPREGLDISIFDAAPGDVVPNPSDGKVDAVKDQSTPDAIADVVFDAQVDSITDAIADSPQDSPLVDAVVDSPVQPVIRTRYPATAALSPMSQTVIENAKAVLAKSATNRTDVFAKIGDSNTVAPQFSDCFNSTDSTVVQLGTYSDLEPTRQFFRKTLVDSSASSFNRDSVAAAVGWSTNNVYNTTLGATSPLFQELSAIKPAFGVIMLGTNETDSAMVIGFESRLRVIVDVMMGAGTLPILTAIPPRTDSTEAAVLVRDMNAVIRAVAQYRQVPFVNLADALEPLPSKGLVTTDGIHLNVFTGSKGCVLTTDGLKFGHNMRNLMTLQALHRVKQFVLDSQPAENTVPPLVGSGTWQDPFVINELPFVDHGDTSKSNTKVVDVYSACGLQNEAGPEVVYKVEVKETMSLRGRVYSDDNADIDIHWLSAPDAASCITRNDKTIEMNNVNPGTYYLVLDSFVTSAGVVRAGGYRMSLVRTN